MAGTAYAHQIGNIEPQVWCVYDGHDVVALGGWCDSTTCHAVLTQWVNPALAFAELSPLVIVATFSGGVLVPPWIACVTAILDDTTALAELRHRATLL